MPVPFAFVLRWAVRLPRAAMSDFDNGKDYCDLARQGHSDAGESRESPNAQFLHWHNQERFVS